MPVPRLYVFAAVGLRCVVTPAILFKFLDASRTVVPFSCRAVDAARLTVFVVVVKYVDPIVPILLKFPFTSIL